jgi:hypothetical protein
MRGPISVFWLPRVHLSWPWLSLATAKARREKRFGCGAGRAVCWSTGPTRCKGSDGPEEGKRSFKL